MKNKPFIPLLYASRPSTPPFFYKSITYMKKEPKKSTKPATPSLSLSLYRLASFHTVFKPLLCSLKNTLTGSLLSLLLLMGSNT